MTNAAGFVKNGTDKAGKRGGETERESKRWSAERRRRGREEGDENVHLLAGRLVLISDD